MNESSDVISSYAPALRGLLVAVFLILCWHYASGLNLWGDEAYSLGFVEGRIPYADPSHLPTYYALLKWLTSLVPGTNEMALRMLHALAFALGLLFGATAVQRLTRSAGIALVSLGVAVLLPEFHFYATNLRMYSLIFLAAMANVDAVSRLAEEDGTPALPRLAWYLVSGAGLVAIDFPGLFYFAIGAAYLASKWLRTGHGRLLPILILPLLPLPAFFLANRSLVANLLRWKPEGNEPALLAGFYDFLKFTYLSFRPGLELVYAAPLPTSFALILAPAVLAVIVWCAFHQAIDAHGRRAVEPLIPLLALCWIVLVPTGFTFTRIFLPSQFFMVVVLVRGTRLPGKAIRTVATAAAVVLVLINFHEALIPTYRLDSVVPYKQIADDVAAISEAESIETVMASDNSLNVESIARYLHRQAVSRPMRVLVVTDTELARRSAELNGRPFLFISQMGEKGALIDIHQLAGRTPRLVRGYVPLGSLPYNDLWKRRYAERAEQPDAIDVWIVR